MIGFTGYAFQNPTNPKSLLNHMGQCFGLDNSCHQRILIQKDFGLCAVARSDQTFGIAADPVQQHLVVVQGHFAPSAFATDIVANGNEGIAAQLMSRYLQSGTAALRNINGRYALALWDAKRGILTLLNDSLGMRRLCWARQGETLLFGTEYKTFLGVSGLEAKLDDTALAEYMAIGYPLEDRTLAKNIKLLPPNSELSASATSTKLLGEPMVSPTSKGSEPLDRCADRIGEALEEVCSEHAKMLNGPLVIPLSGGLDSRTLLGFARRCGVQDIETVTFGHRHCYEVRYARALAKAARSRHRYIYLPDSYVSDYGLQEVTLTEGEIPARYFYYALLKDKLPIGSTLWSGFLGDVLSGGHLSIFDYESLPDERKRCYQLYLDRYNGPWGNRRCWTSEDLIPILIKPRYLDEFAQHPFEAVHRIVASQKAPSFSRRALLAELAQRQRRLIVFQLESLGRSFNIDAPFYDQRVVNAFLTIPDKYLYEQQAYRRMIERFVPKLARIANIKYPKEAQSNHTLKAIKDHIKNSSTPLASGLQWRFEKLKQRASESIAFLSGGWLGKHNRNAFIHGDIAIRKHPEEFIASFERLGELERYFDKDAILNILNEHISGKINASPALFNLWSLATWHRIQGKLSLEKPPAH